jgi:hypothetical protein
MEHFAQRHSVVARSLCRNPLILKDRALKYIYFGFVPDGISIAIPNRIPRRCASLTWGGAFLREGSRREI